MERIDDLQISGFKLLQDTELFCFGIDAVLLSGFADARKGDRCIDLGTGTGVIPVLMAAKTGAARLDGIEIQERPAELAKKSIEMNGLQDRVFVTCGDIRDAQSIYGAGSFDVVTANPPYMPAGSGIVNPEDPLAIARHEIFITLEDIVKTAAKLLHSGGHFYMVHRPRRLSDIICLMREYHVEAKRVRLVYPYADREPNMVLVGGIKDAAPSLKIEKPLILYEKEGVYSEEMKENYGF